MTTETQAPNILNATTCLLVRFHKSGLFRKGDMEKVKTDANKKLLGLRKRIMESDAYDTMMSIARDTRRYIKKRHLPSPFAEGTHLIPLAFINDIDKRVTKAIEGYNNCADLHVQEYPALVAKAQEDLKDQFVEANYFTDMGRYRSLFWIEYRWFDFSPSSSGKVGEYIAMREEQKQVKEIQDLAVQVKGALRVGLRKLIDTLVERLTPKPDGTRKQFAPSTVQKVVEFLELFEGRNVAKDRELALLARQAKEVLEGKDAKMLKQDENAAALVATKMSEIRTNIDSLLQDMPQRYIEIEEEEEE